MLPLYHIISKIDDFEYKYQIILINYNVIYNMNLFKMINFFYFYFYLSDLDLDSVRLC